MRTSYRRQLCALQVRHRTLKTGDRIIEFTQPRIAAVTEQPTYTPSAMVVIDHQAFSSAADPATPVVLITQHFVCIHGQPVPCQALA
jgi:hypothetical protein